MSEEKEVCTNCGSYDCKCILGTSLKKIKTLEAKNAELEQKIKDDDWRWKEYFGASKEDYHKKVKECEELRTRVAELTQDLKDSEMAHGYNMCDFEKLQNRLSTVEKEKETIYQDYKTYRSDAEELQNRLSTLEKENEELRKNTFVWTIGYRGNFYGPFLNEEEAKSFILTKLDENFPVTTIPQSVSLAALKAWKENPNYIKNRLSTLLKASEGLEKAFEGMMLHISKWEGKATYAWTDKANKAIADFRAVKEGK